MARYRLPMMLGGREFDAAEDLAEYPEVGFDLPGISKRVWLPREDLVRIEPPDPPLWSVVLVETAVDGDGEALGLVFQHRPFRGASAWFRAGSSRAHAWAEVCSYSDPVLLLPAERAAVALWQAVELPWSSGSVAVSFDSDGVSLQVGLSPEGLADLAPMVARTAARALWTAADEKDRLTNERQGS